MFKFKSSLILSLSWIFFSGLMFSGCAVEAAKKNSGEQANNSGKAAADSENVVKTTETKTKIDVKPNSPAETVSAFFADLRAKRFRDAIFLTNLRPAIEGLTEAELKDLQVDFESLAQAVSAEIEINGEVVSGDNATVMAKIPDLETGKTEVQTFRLRRQDNYWTILTVDEAAEKAIRTEGKNYFFNLRLETHQQEAKRMIEKISQAEMIYAIQNEGVYADLPTLAARELVSAELPEKGADGYIYNVVVSEDRKNYSAAAAPAEYGKTGKLSYLFEVIDKNQPKMTEKDVGGRFLVK